MFKIGEEVRILPGNGWTADIKGVVDDRINPFTERSTYVKTETDGCWWVDNEYLRLLIGKNLIGGKLI